jgi:hypothetical protein
MSTIFFAATAAAAQFYLYISTTSTIILPVVLYGSESWSLTLREEHRLRVFENRVLRRIFGQKRDEDRRLEKIA